MRPTSRRFYRDRMSIDEKPTIGPPTNQHDSNHDDVAPPQAWDAIAAGYDRNVAPGEEPVARYALRLIGLQADERLLDVAAGTGGLSLPAARLGAEILATDWSPAMISQLESHVRAEGLTRASGRVMDAHRLELDDDGFDVVTSQFGVMLVPDQLDALREMVRVAKPGGRVLIIAYGPPAEFEALQFFVAAVQVVAPEFGGVPDDPPPLEFQVSDPAVLRARLVEAGLHDVRVDSTQQERVEFTDGADCWSWMISSNPIAGMIIGELSSDQQASAREVLHGMIRERAAGEALAVLTAPLNIGTGRK